MASAVSVLAAGAIPIIADIDELITLSPKAVRGPRRPADPRHDPRTHVGPRLRHGRPDEGGEKNQRVVEDCCQCVGGGYKGRSVGAIGDAGAFSFNFFK